MYTHFTYYNGENPYISFSNKNLFRMICKYNLVRDGLYDFVVISERPKYKKSYKVLREILKDFAVIYQEGYSKYLYSWGDFCNWGSFFEEYGKKYGLLREFRENGII